MLSFQQFSALFDTFQHSAARLESRSRTDIPAERHELADFLAGRLPVRRHRDPDSWTAMIERHAAAGRRLRRVRIMDEPLTDYNRFMIYCTRAAVGHGEEVRFLGRADADAMELPDHDFWVLDSARLVLLRFTHDDRPLDHDLVTDRETVARHEEWIRQAFAVGIPWADYVAEDPTREWPPIRLRTRSA